MSKKLLIMSVVLVLFITGCGTKNKQVNKISKEDATENIKVDNSKNINGTNYNLEYITSFERENVFMNQDNVFVSSSNEGYKLVNEKGEDIEGKTFRSLKRLSYYKSGDEPNKKINYVVGDETNTDENNPNRFGLFSYVEEEIIPCEAAKIDALSDRYVEVKYATDKTGEFSDNALIRNGDSYYKGDILIYDLSNKQFVPQIKIVDANEGKGKIEIAGNVIIVDKKAYNSDGSFIDNVISKYNNTFLGDKGVYDKDGKVIFDKKIGVEYILSQDGDYFSFKDGDDIVLVNSEKKEICRKKNVEYTCASDKYIVYRDKNTKTYGVVDYDGNSIIENKSTYISIKGDFIQLGVGSEIESVYYNGQILKENPQFVKINNGVYKQVDMNILELFGLDGKSSVEVEQVGENVEPYLITVRKANSMAYGLIDTTDCSNLLEFGYYGIYYQNGYILAAKGERSYDVYKLIKK